MIGGGATHLADRLIRHFSDNHYTACITGCFFLLGSPKSVNSDTFFFVGKIGSLWRDLRLLRKKNIIATGETSQANALFLLLDKFHFFRFYHQITYYHHITFHHSSISSILSIFSCHLTAQ